MNIGSCLSTNSDDIANAFNRFYTNIGPSLDKRIPISNRDPLSYLSGNYPNSMAVPIITTNDTVTAIKSLKDKNDRFIPTSLIKANANIFAQPLTLIFNKSISNGVFPQNFKNATVYPLY